MDLNFQLGGLDQFLTAIYGGPTTHITLLDALGFDAAQTNKLREHHLQSMAEGFIDVIRKRLTWEEKDLWFRLLARRFGLDGEPAADIEAAARDLSIEPSYAVYAEGEALQRCRYKTTLQDFNKELHRLALVELSSDGERPQKEQVVKKLNRLADLRAAVDLTRMNYEARRTEIMKNVQAELEAIEAEYKPLMEAAEANASALEGQIKNDVLLSGKSIHSEVFQAIYTKGRVSWDSAGISEYARAHPEVLAFRKEGQPTVSLRLAPKGTPKKEN
jgi:hypothetical protein